MIKFIKNLRNQKIIQKTAAKKQLFHRMTVEW
jgi:hypothetical protein